MHPTTMNGQDAGDTVPASAAAAAGQHLPPARTASKTVAARAAVAAEVNHAESNGNGHAVGAPVASFSSAAPAAAAASSASASSSLTSLPSLPSVEPEAHDPSTGRSLRTSYAETTIGPEGRYYWCQGEPTLAKASAHLDTLTASDLAMRATTTAMRESVVQLQSTVASLLDMNARMKRELRAQKLNANRRWLWAGVLLLAITLGQGALRQGLELFAWATSNPHEFFPALLEGLQAMSGYLFVGAFPLVLCLFIHKVLNGYGAGQFTLLRTIVSLVIGVGLQVPLLYFLCTAGLVFLRDLRETPMFDAPSANHSVTICVWLATILLDYVLVVLHHYLE